MRYAYDMEGGIPETRFQPPSTSNTIGTLSIDSGGIRGLGGPAYPYLDVLLRISLVSAEVNVGWSATLPTAEDPIQDYSLHQIYGMLLFGSQEIAHFQSLPISHFSRTSGEIQVSLTIPLDFYRVRLIEEQRVGDVSLTFNCTFQYVKYYQVPRKQGNPPMEKFESSYTPFTVSIPRSDWVDKILPGLGYGKIALVEVPTPESALGETIKGAVVEFEQAQKYLLQGDHPKAIGQCRNALELLSNAVVYAGTPKDGKANPSFADKIDYLFNVLPGIPTGVRRENLARMCKDLYGFTSIPEHPSPPEFTRDDAEMTIHITIAVLSYLGKFLARAAEAARQNAIQASVVVPS